jgi:CO/xanthine dehydrogenase FAD-binding subunit
MRLPGSYFAPRDLDEALQLMREDGAVLLAGGTDVFPARGRAPLNDSFIDITRIETLRGIRRTESGWCFGAATTWSDIVAAPLPPAFDGLKAAAREVGSVQIQNSATLAGNLCNASPAADGIPPLLTLDAEIVIAHVSGTRRLPLASFVTGPRKTALAPGEIVTAIEIPPPPRGARSAFKSWARGAIW